MTRDMKKGIGVALAVAAGLGAFAGVDFTQYVDPAIGTEYNGHTHVAASYPFGMVQAGPDTGRGNWDYCSGYRNSDKTIWGFSQTHLSGTGCPDLADFRLQPGGADRAYPFRKETEVKTPGYYAVTLDEIDADVEIAVSKHAAIYRITYRGDAHPELLLDTQWMMINSDGAATCVSDNEVTADAANRVVEGRRTTYGWNRRVAYFHLSTDRAWTMRRLPTVDQREKGGRYVLRFNEVKQGETVTVKIGLSATSVAAAKANLSAEIPGWNLSAVRADAVREWNRLLGSMAAEGDRGQLVSFYTSLYHLFLQPNNIADAGAKPYFSTFSTWDTFRAAHPLYTILAPEVVRGFVDSMLKDGEKHGYVSIWTLWGGDNQCMIGTHSIPVIVDAILKGLWKGDENAALDMLVRSVTGSQKEIGRQKGNFDLLEQYGYYPFDLIRGESVSRTLECAYDDACIARLANRLGRKDVAGRFARRAASWKNVFDPERKLVRGKDTKGNWRTPFNPFELGHGHDTANDFTEGNAYQYTWHVMQDPMGLIDACGGKEAFATQLDRLFVLPPKVEGSGCVIDVSGLIGQYAHGNEPSHHVIYFFQFADRPDLTAKYIRRVFDEFYLPKPDGLCGNDDCGQMSAWYLFSAAGFYPFDPCGGDYVLGAPQLPKIVFQLADGKTFTVVARNLSRENMFVKSVTLNGRPVQGFVLRHADVMAGGELVFEMGR